MKAHGSIFAGRRLGVSIGGLGSTGPHVAFSAAMATGPVRNGNHREGFDQWRK